MEVLDTVLTLVVLAALWVAAVVFGRDSRDGRDWSRRPEGEGARGAQGASAKARAVASREEEVPPRFVR